MSALEVNVLVQDDGYVRLDWTHINGTFIVLSPSHWTALKAAIIPYVMPEIRATYGQRDSSTHR
jgi:hypothetical protein